MREGGAQPKLQRHLGGGGQGRAVGSWEAPQRGSKAGLAAGSMTAQAAVALLRRPEDRRRAELRGRVEQ